jgi:succinyl-diaminopimelate desuccinylase
MLPGDCRMEADIRLPVGLDKAPVLARIQEILRDFPAARMEEQSAACNPSSWCDPDGEMLRLIQKNAGAFAGIVPAPTVTLGATDCKFWRYRGVPAYVYGPSPGRMSAPDESVAVEEFVAVLKTHVMSAYDYLAAAA